MENGDEHDSQMNAVFGIVVSTRPETPRSEVRTSAPTDLSLELHPSNVSFSPARCVQHRDLFFFLPRRFSVHDAAPANRSGLAHPVTLLTDPPA
jgi:hypothetical protein